MSIVRDIIVGRRNAIAAGETSAGRAVNDIRRARAAGSVAVVKRGGGLPPTSSDGYDVVPAGDVGTTVTVAPPVQPYTPPVPIMPMNRFALDPRGGQPGTTLTSTGGGGISLGGVLQDLARRGVDALGRRVENALAGPTQSSDCGTGMVRVGNKCVSLGDAFPGGDPFVTTAGGVPMVGAFGLPAFSPVIVGSVNGNPIRRCPARTVLGLDDLCYPKGTIGRNYRKHPPRPRPPVSAFDAKMMRKYGKGGSKANAAKKLAMEAGFSCKAK